MQTFSNLQRKSPNAVSLGYAFGALALVVYEMLSTALIFLPPLMGVFFTYIIIKKSEAERLLSGLAAKWFLAFAFLIFAEQIHGFLFLSSVIVYIVFYSIFYEWLVVNFKSRILMFAFFNFCAYIGIWAVSNLVLYMLDQTLLKYSYEYLYFMLCETLLCLYIFRGARL